MSALPILYSFRRCPYAIRARMAIASAGIPVELREVLLRNKPAAMLAASAKGTVPVLQLPDGRVIDESIEVMRWALSISDPQGWMSHDDPQALQRLIDENDGEFKKWLDQYKYADRFPEHSAAHYRAQAEPFLETLNDALERRTWLAGSAMGFADVAVFPFLRQFAMVDRPWFDAAPYGALQLWLNKFLQSTEFTQVMDKNSPWEEGEAPVVFPAQTRAV